MKNVTHPTKDMKKLQDSIGDDHFPIYACRNRVFVKKMLELLLILP